tara:strand:+ start:10275 stop:10658 length:384 start_codon:yes stop_codon:yes gene_type:complete
MEKFKFNKAYEAVREGTDSFENNIYGSLIIFSQDYEERGRHVDIITCNEAKTHLENTFKEKMDLILSMKEFSEIKMVDERKKIIVCDKNYEIYENCKFDIKNQVFRYDTIKGKNKGIVKDALRWDYM